MNTDTANQRTTNPDFEAFARACREDTGRHFLDSGGIYGRHHEKPPMDPAQPAVTVEVTERGEGKGYWISARIETAHFLTGAFTHDAKMQAEFEEWAEGDARSWFELGEDYCREVLGLYQHARDNAYNVESDLSQVFIWEVYTPNEDERDWLFARDALTIIYVHTGCDVRGGYGRPLFCRSKGEYSVPVDFVAQFDAVAGTDEDGNELSRDELADLSERWQCGYSSRPAGEVEKEVAGFDCVLSPDSFKATLRTGERVQICASLPYLG